MFFMLLPVQVLQLSPLGFVIDTQLSEESVVVDSGCIVQGTTGANICVHLYTVAGVCIDILNTFALKQQWSCPCALANIMTDHHRPAVECDDIFLYQMSFMQVQAPMAMYKHPWP